MKQFKHLYVVTRRDLSPGYQGVQSQHALVEFACDFPEVFKKWKTESNYLCWVSVKNREELVKYVKRAYNKGIKVSIFNEPDVDFELTAFVMEPGVKSRKLLKGLPLALSEIKEK